MRITDIQSDLVTLFGKVDEETSLKITSLLHRIKHKTKPEANNALIKGLQKIIVLNNQDMISYCEKIDFPVTEKSGTGARGKSRKSRVSYSDEGYMSPFMSHDDYVDDSWFPQHFFTR